MPKKLWGNEFRDVTVCVERYDHCVLQGRLYHATCPSGQQFDSLIEFLREMETLMDNMQFPQSFSKLRTFQQAAPPTEDADLPAIELPKNSLATFQLRVLFRQNSSWQGSVTWLEQKQEEPFRSVLELVMLMHSALSAKEE